MGSLDLKNPVFLLSAFRKEQFPFFKKNEVAFLGRSNAGKSSVLNMLTGKKIARIGKTPGRTQAINFFESKDILLADLPGYGFARVSKRMRDMWGWLIADYLKNRENLKLLVWIFDIRRIPDKLDYMLREWIEYYNRRCLIVFNKIDKIPKNKMDREIKKYKDFTQFFYVKTSALKGIGRDELLNAINKGIFDK